MSIIERIVQFFAPHCCLDCGIETDKLLCNECVRGVPVAASCCYRCQTPTANYRVCKHCASETPLRQALAYAEYKHTAKALVHHLKFERAQSAAGELAALIARRLPRLPPSAVVVHVPTATGRVRMRGYDHARLIARELARQTGARHWTALARVGQKRQVGAGRADRFHQLHDAFRPVRPETMRGKHVVLVDDVMTTGATLEAAARVLIAAGAARVSAVVFARA